MAKAPFRFDEIGAWSVLKLDIIEKYGSAYTKAFNKRGSNLKKYYIDGFSGAGVHVEKRTREQIEGSPARALKIDPAGRRLWWLCRVVCAWTPTGSHYGSRLLGPCTAEFL